MYWSGLILYLHRSKEIGFLHNPDELLLTDFTISISVCLVDHFLEFIIIHGLSELSGNPFQILQGDFACAVIIKQSKSL